MYNRIMNTFNSHDLTQSIMTKNILLGMLVVLGAVVAVSALAEISSPLAQYNSGIPMQEIQCSKTMTLMETPRGTPACVNQDTAEKLKDRGWQVIRQADYEPPHDTSSVESDEPEVADDGMMTDSLHAMPDTESDERITVVMTGENFDGNPGVSILPEQYMPTANFTYPRQVSLGQEFDIEFSYVYDHPPETINLDDGEILPTEVYVGYRPEAELLSIDSADSNKDIKKRQVGFRPEVDLLSAGYVEQTPIREWFSKFVKHVPFEGKTHDYDRISTPSEAGYIDRPTFDLLERNRDGNVLVTSDMFDTKYENGPPVHDRITMRVNEELVPSDKLPTIRLAIDNWLYLDLYFYPNEGGGYLSTDSRAVFLTDHQTHLIERGVDPKLAA